MGASLVVDSGPFNAIAISETSNSATVTSMATSGEPPSIELDSTDSKMLPLYPSSSSASTACSEFLFTRGSPSSWNTQSDSESSPLNLSGESPSYSSAKSLLSSTSSTADSMVSLLASPQRSYSVVSLLRWRNALKAAGSNIEMTTTLRRELIDRVDSVGNTSQLTYPSRLTTTQQQQQQLSGPPVCTGNWWPSWYSDQQASCIGDTSVPFLKSSSIEVNHEPFQLSLSSDYNLLHPLNRSTQPDEDSKETNNDDFDTNKVCRSSGFNQTLKSIGSIESDHRCDESTFYDEIVNRRSSTDLLLDSAVGHRSGFFPAEFSSDSVAEQISAALEKPLPRYVAAFSLSNLGILQTDRPTSSSMRRILPFGHPNYFAWLKTLPHNEFVYLARSVARYRRTSRLYPTPSTIVSINLCACCTPHPEPVSGFKFQTSFWLHHLPVHRHLHGVLDTFLSLMLLELHPDLDVVEFLDRRLPAIIRQQVGNRLDRNFVVQIFGTSFMRSHLSLNNWTVSHLPQCSEADMRRLRAHPLYHHMLYDVSHRADVPVFRNFNLCPIQYLANRPLPLGGFSTSPVVNSVPAPPPISPKSLSGLSTVCSSSDFVCGASSKL